MGHHPTEQNANKNVGSLTEDRTASERRLSPRYPCTSSAEIIELGSEMKLSTQTSDLGLGGCYVDTLNPLNVGTQVKIRLTHRNQTFESHARVVYTHPGVGMGLTFTAIQREQLTILEKWTKELSGQPSLSPDLAATPIPGEPPEVRQCQVLVGLINLLFDKHILTESDRSVLLRKLSR